ncbi:sensor histidine kinase [Tsuneonella sp. HG094]
MNRIMPRSLLGQVLLAVAGALLVAQAISAALIYRAAEERRTHAVVGVLALQLSNAQAVRDRGADVAEPRRRARQMRNMHRPRVEFSSSPPAMATDVAEPEIAAEVADVIGQAGAVRVVSHPAEIDPRLIARQREGRLPTRWAAGRDGRMYVASIRLADGIWATARTVAPVRQPGLVRGIVTQTLVLFGVMMIALWLILRRITGPLAALRRRLEDFARTQKTDGQLPVEGPDDVRRLIAAHNAMEQRIAAMLDEKDVMLGAIGHDLKTPLAALRVRIESVEDDAERAKMAAGIEDIVRTLDDILSLARVGRATEPPERTELGALAASVVEEFEDMGEAVELAEGPRVVAPVHVTWAKRALRNLVSNAVRYGGGATVAVERAGSEVVLRVTDTGPGIAPERLATITEPFVRGEVSRNRETGGAGLGLTLARAIAEAHGGRLVLANRPEGGLLAELRLPA